MKYAQIHCHTTHSNEGCVEALSSPKQLVLKAKEKNISILAITDHNTMNGYEEAKEFAEEAGILLIPAMEIDTNGRGQILAYGISRPIPKGQEMKAAIKDIHDQNGVAIIAHPFDVIRGTRNIKDICLDADGLETENFGATYNKKAQNFAESNKIKIRTAGADAHTPKLINSVVLQIDSQCETVDDFIRILKNNEFQIVRSRSYLSALCIGAMNIFVTKFLWFSGIVKPTYRL